MTDSSPTMLPARIDGLERLAKNLWWSWQPGARTLFRRLSPSLWLKYRKNPVEVLRRLDARRLEEAAADPLFLREYDAVMAEFEGVLSARRSWFADRHGDTASGGVAYFCAEFGVHASIPIYSGGLGILAGDHFKEGSDLEVPLVGVGLLYQKGYFRQKMGPGGEQHAIDEPFHPESMPLERLTGNGEGTEEELAKVRLAGRDVHLGVWRLHVGRSPIYLMDTDVEKNHPDDRALSQQLYRGDLEMRIRQEIVLGIGGVRVLRRLGIQPDVWHANEGHAAFMVLERLREQIQEGTKLDVALDRIAVRTVFTTHTPVAAGHDAFPREMIERYFGGYVAQLGLDLDRMMELGRHPHHDGRFHMSALALRLSRYRNGVSRLHGQVARSMWAELWPDGADAPAPDEGASTNGVRSARIVSFPGAPPPDRVPIGHVTNGVHLPTWVSPSMRDLFDRYLGPDWEILQDDPALWERALDLPDHRLWEAHLANKGRLFSVLRQRARDGWREAGTTAEQVVAAGTLLDPEYLTIGFARRFATYKRASLVFRDLERLEGILLHSERPVQLVFAGKAHPADAPGQEILAEIYRMAMNPRLAGRVAFASDYEIVLARDMYSGVDLWLNNPRPPMEACGTSGQKAAINGVPQLSTLDGWWAEGWTGLNGWAIRPDAPIEQEVDPVARDGADAEAIYDLLEGEIAPLFYDRDVDGVPRSWIRVMKQAIRTAGARFSARRMLKEYVETYYVPAALGGREDEAVADRTGD